MTVIVQDAFTGTNGDSLDAHTPDVAPVGSAWAESLGNWQIATNAAALVAASNGGHATIETGEADCTLTVKANSTTTSTFTTRDVGIVVRWVDVDNHYRVGINAQSDQFQISQRVAAITNILVSTPITITPGTLYTIVVILNGATITATLDGANEISYPSATAGQTATVHGIMARETADRLDDFLVEIASGPDYTLAAELGSYTLTGQAAAVQVARLLNAGVGAYVLSGQTANLLANRLLAADPGTYTLDGLPVTLVWSGEVPIVTPDSRIYVIEAEDRIFVVVADNRTFVVPSGE